jgi:hypothetical protein
MKPTEADLFGGAHPSVPLASAAATGPWIRNGR